MAFALRALATAVISLLLVDFADAGASAEKAAKGCSERIQRIKSTQDRFTQANARVTGESQKCEQATSALGQLTSKTADPNEIRSQQSSVKSACGAYQSAQAALNLLTQEIGSMNKDLAAHNCLALRNHQPGSGRREQSTGGKTSDDRQSKSGGRSNAGISDAVPNAGIRGTAPSSELSGRSIPNNWKSACGSPDCGPSHGTSTYSKKIPHKTTGSSHTTRHFSGSHAAGHFSGSSYRPKYVRHVGHSQYGRAHYH
jgi:hypothetical protein